MKQIPRIIALSLCLATTSFSSEFSSEFEEQDFHNRPILMIKRDLKSIENIRSQPFIDLKVNFYGLTPTLDKLYRDIEDLKTRQHSISEQLELLRTESKSNPSSPKSEMPIFYREDELSSEIPLNDNWIQEIIKQLSPIDYIDPTLFQTLAEQQESLGMRSVYTTIFQDIEALKQSSYSLTQSLLTFEEVLGISSETSSPIVILPTTKPEEEQCSNIHKISSSYSESYVTGSFMNSIFNTIAESLSSIQTTTSLENDIEETGSDSDSEKNSTQAAVIYPDNEEEIF